jgi:hypothetical protein
VPRSQPIGGSQRERGASAAGVATAAMPFIRDTLRDTVQKEPFPRFHRLM